MAHGFHSTWNPPRPGIEPASPALAGRFLTTGPPGKSWREIKNKQPHLVAFHHFSLMLINPNRRWDYPENLFVNLDSLHIVLTTLRLDGPSRVAGHHGVHHWEVQRLFVCWWASLVAQRLKRLPAMRETWVRPLGWEYPLEKEMSTHSSILTWRIPWTEEPGGLQSTGSQRVRHNWATSLPYSLTHSSISYTALYNFLKRMIKISLWHCAF